MSLIGKNSSNQSVNLLNPDLSDTQTESDYSKDTPREDMVIDDWSDMVFKIKDQKKKLVYVRTITVEGKQKMIRKIANALFPEASKYHIDLNYDEWINQLIVNQGQMSEKNGAFNNKKKLIASVLRKIIEFQSGVPIGQVPWKRISKDDIDGWPFDVDIKSPSRLNALELNKVLMCLDKLEFRTTSRL
jgi:hypothetical protein